MKNAFLDPTTSILKAHGYVSSNQPGDILMVVPDSFALTPGLWQWNGTTWISVLPSLPPPNPLIEKLTIALASTAVPAELKAIFTIWKTQL